MTYKMGQLKENLCHAVWSEGVSAWLEYLCQGKKTSEAAEGKGS